MLNSVEFYKNLPPKQCCDCGSVIQEQHECYYNHCEECLSEKI